MHWILHTPDIILTCLICLFETYLFVYKKNHYILFFCFWDHVKKQGEKTKKWKKYLYWHYLIEYSSYKVRNNKFKWKPPFDLTVIKVESSIAYLVIAGNILIHLLKFLVDSYAFPTCYTCCVKTCVCPMNFYKRYHICWHIPVYFRIYISSSLVNRTTTD